MSAPISEHPLIKHNDRLKYSAIWTVSRSKAPDSFNALYNWWETTLATSPNTHQLTKERLHKANVTGNIAIFIQGVVHNINDGSISITFIIAHGGSASEKQWWSLPVNQFTDLFDPLFAPGTSVETVDTTFRLIVK
jgi:hypothetical protein